MRKRRGKPPGLIPDGPKIRELRLGLRLSTVQVAAMMGSPHHPESIVKAEKQNRPISELFAARLAYVLGVKAEDITSPPPEPETLAS